MTIGSLGYIGFKVKDPDAWSTFATGVRVSRHDKPSTWGHRRPAAR